MHQILSRMKELLQTSSNVYMVRIASPEYLGTNTIYPNQVKVEAAQTLRVLGIKLRTVAESFIGNLHVN